MITIVIDNEIDDDWMKSLPGYADEVAIHRAIADKLKGKNKRAKIVKGGPTSGNYGHAGRPGEVGGSAPSAGIAHEPTGAYDGLSDEAAAKLKAWEDDHVQMDRVYHIEQALIVSEDGTIMRDLRDGNKSNMNIPPGDYKNAILTHNHPPHKAYVDEEGYVRIEDATSGGTSQPPSYSDMGWAIINDAAEIRAVGYGLLGDTPTLYRLARRGNSWGVDYKTIIGDWNNFMSAMEGEMAELREAGFGVAQISSVVIGDFWMKSSKKYGFTYIEEKLR